MTRRRVKVGDVEVTLQKNPAPDKTNWLVTRHRPRTSEYLSKQEAYTEEQAGYLFTQVVGQEELRQKRAAAAAAVGAEPDLPAPYYADHPLYARF
jgi:hypothetical protein